MGEGATGRGRGTAGPAEGAGVAAPVVHVDKPQRLRDPVHDIIAFDLSDEFEHTIWRVIQTPPFQRLRRIRQLGFSEFVYPGATHTRFNHSIGVFHTARRLMDVIETQIRTGRRRRYLESRAHRALAAALVHDVGHGMFSHGFEPVGEELNLPMAAHETVSETLIRESEIAEELNALGSGFAADVATLIGGSPTSFYDAVVSSQFDADRLDYMRRDRLTTGVENGAIDFEWLVANLEIGEVPTGTDYEGGKSVETFVLGPKAIHAAEDFVLALFQLYPTIYFHKTTRAAEKVFSALMIRIVELVREDAVRRTGLGKAHPLIRFASAPDSLDAALALDDTVLWGSLAMLEAAPDRTVAEMATRLRRRRLPKCIDIRTRLQAELRAPAGASREDRQRATAKIDQACEVFKEEIEEWRAGGHDGVRLLLTDEGKRAPYKGVEDSKGPLDQIRIRLPDGEVGDIRDHSPVVDGIERFRFLRAYVDEGDQDAKDAVDRFVTAALDRVGAGDG